MNKILTAIFLVSAPALFGQSSGCQLSNPDTSVFDIILNDTISSLKQVGIMPTLIELKDGLPHLKYCTNDKKQTLTLYFHPGGYANEFAEFNVQAYSETDSARILKTKSFRTEKGIQLGITKEQVISILGKCYKITGAKNNTEVIKYHIDDFIPLLNRFPIYSTIAC
ncbi:MAG TPA: hypothetical protein VI757_05555 [Bacteroidia bacterium]|nr:hypothetical protein [Bacteroidia bacterium]